MEWNNEGIGLVILLLGIDVWLTYKIYNKEYKDNENKE